MTITNLILNKNFSNKIKLFFQLLSWLQIVFGNHKKGHYKKGGQQISIQNSID